MTALSQSTLHLQVGAWFELAGVAVLIGATFAAIAQGLTAVHHAGAGFGARAIDKSNC